MSTTVPDRATATGAGVEPAAPVVVVAECAGDGVHLMVAAHVDPGWVVELRGEVADLLGAEGLWCGPGAASSRCRDALVGVVISGGVGAVIIDAVGFDDPVEARAACLRAVVADADEAGVDRVLLVRDDIHAGQDTDGAAALARAAGASPTLRCSHADGDTEPITVVAEILVWCWTRGGEYRRVIAPALTSVHLV